jgi:hypothetical protein
MPAEVQLYHDAEMLNPVERITLADFELDEVYDDDEVFLGEGQPIKIYAFNTGDTVLREMSVHVDGDGAGFIQLSVDNDGEPGVWAAAGESIFATSSQSIFPDESFEFWARPLFTSGDREGTFDFDFLIKGKSIGVNTKLD